MSLLRFLMILLLLGNNFSPMTANSLPTLNKKSTGLNGVHLKLGAIHVSWLSFSHYELMTNYLIYFSVPGKMPLFDVLTLRPDGNYTHTGSSKVLYDWVAEKLNFTYDFIFVYSELIYVF
jgi:hypothetical protein